LAHCRDRSPYALPMNQCDEVLSSVYNYSWYPSEPQDDHRTLHQHAVVFVFLATASLFDPDLPPRVRLRLSLPFPQSFTTTVWFARASKR
jgi:hypothetical protein